MNTFSKLMTQFYKWKNSAIRELFWGLNPDIVSRSGFQPHIDQSQGFNLISTPYRPTLKFCQDFNLKSANVEIWLKS